MSWVSHETFIESHGARQLHFDFHIESHLGRYLQLAGGLRHLDLGFGVAGTSHLYQSFITRLTTAYIRSNVYHVSKVASSTASRSTSVVPPTSDKH